MKAAVLLLSCLLVVVSVSGGVARTTRRQHHHQLDPRLREALLAGRVVGGLLAEEGQFPHQVSLQYFGGHFCGGNIVSEDVIVTAAHCAQGWSPEELTVFAGINDLGNLNGAQSRQVVEVEWNSEFPGAGGLDNDVAYLRLAEPLEWTDRVQPVKLPRADQTPSLAPGDCTVSGWGATDSAGSVYPDELHYGDIQGLSDDDCQELMDNLANPPFGVEFVPEANFCAFTPEGGLNACFGDSGGPLTCIANDDGERYLFGIVSWGPTTCGEQGFPAVYVDVLGYLDWFEENAGVTPFLSE